MGTSETRQGSGIYFKGMGDVKGSMKRKEAEKMSFTDYLEEVVGISWNDYDNNYSGRQADEIWEDYLSYIGEKEK